jgi:hypothetical protein
MADYSENINLHLIESGYFYICKAPKALFGSATSMPAAWRHFVGYIQKMISQLIQMSLNQNVMPPIKTCTIEVFGKLKESFVFFTHSIG